MKAKNASIRPRTARGFRRAGSLCAPQIRKAGESRGFAITRLLTHWDEAVGPDFAALARPVDVRYGRSGDGATLTVLARGADAPMLEMQKEALRARVNACYGYAAIARIRLTQTAPVGFGEAPAPFAAKPPVRRAAPVASKAVVHEAHDLTEGVENETLRRALQSIGERVLSRNKPHDEAKS